MNGTNVLDKAPAAVPVTRPTSATLLDIDRATFAAAFGHRPFRVRHQLVGHPLLTLPRLVDLARLLPPESVEYNAGNIPINLDPGLTPHTGLSAEETIRRIEDCQSWLALKNVEQDPEYRDLLHGCLREVEALGHPYARGVGRREAFVFISSPGAVTPYHMDPELNFLLQVRGKKLMTVFPGDDPALVSEQELERFYSGAHRNLVFREEYGHKATPFELSPGEGVHVPVTAPHWVRNGEQVSVSFSITFQTRATERRSALYHCNHCLRGRGWSPAPVGRSPLRDAVKYNGLRVLRRLRRLWPGAR